MNKYIILRFERIKRYYNYEDDLHGLYRKRLIESAQAVEEEMAEWIWWQS